MIKKVNILNKKAKFEYELLDEYSAGIVLTGTEIKSIRDGKASICESFCEFSDSGELFIINMFIDEYTFGNHGCYKEARIEHRSSQYLASEHAFRCTSVRIEKSGNSCQEQ